MGALAPVAPRLAKLLPMLSSNHDGEKLATLAAIERALTAAKLSWHDLAAKMVGEGQREPEASYTCASGPDAAWPAHQIAAWCIKNQMGEINAAEGEFLRGIARNPHWNVSPKQVAWLWRIVSKIGG
jgi:hypothetical protein